MKITFILKNLSEYFYGKLDNCYSDDERYKILINAEKNNLNVTHKIGDGSFRDGMDFNVAKHNGKKLFGYKLESRRGYKLVTFNI